MSKYDDPEDQKFYESLLNEGLSAGEADDMMKIMCPPKSSIIVVNEWGIKVMDPTGIVRVSIGNL